MKTARIFLTLFTCLGLALALPAIAQAGPPLQEKGTIDEIVNLGTTVHGPPVYAAVAGRMVSQTAAFYAKSGIADISMVFPAPGAGRSISTARMYILTKTAYTGTATLNVYIYSLSGTLRHTVTNAPVDLLAATPEEWILLPLSADVNNLYIMPGEFLAAQLTLDPVPVVDGSFDARVMFEFLTH